MCLMRFIDGCIMIPSMCLMRCTIEEKVQRKTRGFLYNKGQGCGLNYFLTQLSKVTKSRFCELLSSVSKVERSRVVLAF